MMCRCIGVWGIKVGFISSHHETSHWKSSSWPAVPDADRPTVIWADLDQSRIPNLRPGAVLIPLFIHLLSCSFIYALHLPVHSFDPCVLDFELSSFDKKQKDMLPPACSNRRDTVSLVIKALSAIVLMGSTVLYGESEDSTVLEMRLKG